MLLASRATVGVAATSLALALATLAPVAAIPLFLVAPIPGTLLIATVKPAAGFVWATLLGAIAGAFFGVHAAVAVLGLCTLPALVCGLAIRQRGSVEAVVAATAVAWSAGVAATAWSTTGSAAAVLSGVRGLLERSVELTLAAAREAGAAATVLDSLAADSPAIVDGVMSVLPAIVLLIGGALALTNLLAVRAWWRVAVRMNLRRWQMPEAAIWVFIASGFAMFLPSTAISLVARNIFAVLLGCYFCQGLAVVSFYLARFRVPRGFRLAGYALIALHHLFAGLVLALGVLDFWANFRRLHSSTVGFQSGSGGS
ncbi:YybS family protein [Candidatus Binatia bacterium]|nr:YybS family protein [Candidatus Binatia bacterium]